MVASSARVGRAFRFSANRVMRGLSYCFPFRSFSLTDTNEILGSSFLAYQQHQTPNLITHWIGRRRTTSTSTSSSPYIHTTIHYRYSPNHVHLQTNLRNKTITPQEPNPPTTRRPTIRNPRTTRPIRPRPSPSILPTRPPPLRLFIHSLRIIIRGNVFHL